MADRTIREILRLSPSSRQAIYQVTGKSNKHIDRVTIDGNVFKDYSAFSFLMEKSYVKSPVRSGDGSIGNLDSYAWFLTPHLKIDFSLMSIDSYRTMMKLIQSKNEFTVTCYDIVNDRDVTHKMYFATEQMPKLWAIARALDGAEWTELLGVQDYTVELIGTNTDVENVMITYHLNVPTNVIWTGNRYTSEESPKNTTINVGATVSTGVGTEVIYIANITFGNTYKFKYWCETADGSGFKYFDSHEYLFTTDMQLYAIWERGAT